MVTAPKIYLSGLGAIGSVYASRIYDTNSGWISVIVDKERMEQYHRNGITVNGKPYHFQFVQPNTAEGPADLILIAVKQHHLANSIEAIRNFVGENTVILSLLNGITSEDIVAQEYGAEKLLYSFVVGTDAVREGRSTSFSSMGKIVFGEKANAMYSTKVNVVKEIFDRANVPYTIPENMLHELWWKFMINVGINQVSAVLRAHYGVFQKAGEARELMEMAFREVILLSQKMGINLDEDDIQNSIRVINTLSPEGKTSMLQDIEAGRKTEVELFAGTVIELGRRYEVATPVNDILWLMIRSLEQT
jgi:2-dehydropantoate 2-reductase